MRIAVLLFLGAFLGGCATGIDMPFGTLKADVVPPQGFLFSAFSAPLSTEFDQTDASPSRHGSSNAFFFVIPFTPLSFALGDASIEGACSDGRIKNLAYADYDFVKVFLFFGSITVHAYGEP